MSAFPNTRPEIVFERLFDGRPIISPRGDGWESGVTFNTAAVFVENVPANAKVLNALLGDDAVNHPDGVAVLHYRARPKEDPGFPWTRSYVGLSVHAPDMTPIKRWDDPVVSPGGEGSIDELGVEDPRVTFHAGRYWMVYCGVAPRDIESLNDQWVGTVCMAVSDDLVHWTKLGAVPANGPEFDPIEPGHIRVNNKDGVLFPDAIDGKVYLLHRPMNGANVNWTVDVAVADRPEGPYLDLGPIHDAFDFPEYAASWPGAGSTPIHVGGKRYLSVEHTGNTFANKQRKYVLDFFLYDFEGFDPENPRSLVKARLDDVFRPETFYEVHGPYPDSVSNVVFACGAYVHDGWLYVPYGGGDTYILAARVRMDEVMSALERAIVA